MWGITNGGRENRGKNEEVVEDKTGKVGVKITIEKISGNTRAVEIIVRDSANGDRVFTADYQTNELERPAYYHAEEFAKKYVETQGLVIDGEIVTNVEVGYVRTLTNKRSR